MTLQQPSEDNVRRILLILEYDGGRFGGSQIQKNAPSIQGELERAIQMLTGEKARAAFAGRTDAGCHALGQVASFLTRRPFATTVFRNGLNYWLPEEIAVRQAKEAPLDFEVRRRALRRHYRYLVCNGPSPSPLLRKGAWHVRETLDLDAMRQAAERLVGRHDFAAFAGSLDNPRASTVRNVHRVDLWRRGRLVGFDVEANAFLPHQVRRMTGALVQVGRGRLTAEQIETLLREAKPSSAGPAAPPQGLYLVRVTYAGLDTNEETDIDEDIQCEG